MRNFLLTPLLFVTCLVLAGCGEEGAATSRPVPAPLDLPITPVQETDVPREYVVPGNVVSDNRIQIASKITGYIRDVRVHEGARIGKGDILVQIDSNDVENTIKQTEAALKAAESNLADALADVEKYAKLRASETISAETLRKANVRRQIAESSRLEARAARDAALSQRAYATIKSPVDAIVIARHRQNGDLATPGTPILTLESSHNLLFETFVAESRVKDIHPDDSVTLEIDALAGTVLQGRILRVVPSGDPVTRRYEVKIALPDHVDLMPGMFGRARFVLGLDRVLAVSRQSLVERGGLVGVFVLDDDNRARFRWLHIGREWPDAVEVKAGLGVDERIVARDDGGLRDGTPVVVRETR